MTQHAIQPGPEMTPGQALPMEKLHNAKDMLLNATAAIAVAADMPGANEMLRGAAFTATELAAHNPYITAAVTTAATLGIEVGGAFGATRLLETERGHRAMGWVRRTLGKVGIRGAIRTTPVTDAAIAFTTGVAAMTTVKQEGDPTRTASQNRRYGMKVAAGISLASAPLSYMIAEGVGETITTEKMGLAALGVAAGAALMRRARQHVRERASTEVLTTDLAQEGAEAMTAESCYDLTEAELKAIETKLVERVARQHGHTIAAVWLKGSSPEANFVRTHEAQTFPDINIPGLFEAYDDKSIFMAMVDTRRGAGKARVIRGTRITGRQFSTTNPDAADPDSGMAMIRDMVDDGQLTQQEVADYYRGQGIDIGNCISVETNFKIGERARRKFGFIPMAQLAYLSIYQYAFRHNVRSTDGAVFAHINKASEDSLTRVGIEIEPIAGRKNLRTPAGPGSPEPYDDKFMPVAMLNTANTAKAMRPYLRFAASEIYM